MNMKRIIAAVVTASIIGGAAGSGMQMINAEELGPHFTVPHKELKSSGSYDSVSWTIDEEGTLTISGTGYLPNNFTGQDVYGHWFTCIPVSVKKIVIEEGITEIADHTFASCNVVSVDIASSVKYINNGAFEYCTDLETVNLHEGLERIENYAFENCWSLESIKLPESVTYIGSRAFGICNHLKEISFPESLTEFPEGITECYEKDSFIFTPWYEEYLENNRFVIWNGVVLDGKPVNGVLEIPDTATGIAVRAFAYYGEELTTVIIPDGVTVIGEDTFRGCESLKSVSIAGTVKEIKEDAFAYCKTLESLTISEGVEKIGRYAFNGCHKLTSVTVPASTNSIDEMAFGECRNLETATILDPECDIFMNQYTITANVIRGYKGSTAEKYAETYGYKFEAIDEDETAYTGSDEITAKENVSDCLKGDATGDGIVDISDITMLSLYLLGDNSLEENQQKAADIDDNDKVDLADLARLMQYISKKIESL